MFNLWHGKTVWNSRLCNVGISICPASSSSSSPPSHCTGLLLSPHTYSPFSTEFCFTFLCPLSDTDISSKRKANEHIFFSIKKKKHSPCRWYQDDNIVIIINNNRTRYYNNNDDIINKYHVGRKKIDRER